MANDQRYCLECGNRRGDPRLPFMDAVVFMEAVKGAEPGGRPAPPPEQTRPGCRQRLAVAGVATLVLAIGVGVLIGRSGDSGPDRASAAPQVIKVEGGGGGETKPKPRPKRAAPAPARAASSASRRSKKARPRKRPKPAPAAPRRRPKKC